MKFDLIGDVHGHAAELRALLERLGYEERGGVYAHSERRVLFVGDYIDRGPAIREVLRIVRTMTEAGQAIALMGNHEYNALCYRAEKAGGGHLREHSRKNFAQHRHTLEQFQGYEEEYEAYLDWFFTLPLFFEADGFRAVHACWDDASIGFLRGVLEDGRLPEGLLAESAREGSALFVAVEVVLKGKELALPAGVSYLDTGGHRRRMMRVKWWEDPVGMTYRALSVVPIPGLPDVQVGVGASVDVGTSVDVGASVDERGGVGRDVPVGVGRGVGHNFYGPTEKAVFFGHYWLTGEPALHRENVCCLDYSVARGGSLVAYRFDGEARLTNRNFVQVGNAAG